MNFLNYGMIGTGTSDLSYKFFELDLTNFLQWRCATGSNRVSSTMRKTLSFHSTPTTNKCRHTSVLRVICVWCFWKSILLFIKWNISDRLTDPLAPKHKNCWKSDSRSFQSNPKIVFVIENHLQICIYSTLSLVLYPIFSC